MSLLIGALIFLVLSAIFSGAEIAYISANKLNIELLKERNTMTSRILGRFYGSPKDFIGAMLIGNNISLVVLTYLLSKLIEPYLISGIHNEFLALLIITLGVTILVLIFGEFLPKTFFRVYSHRLLSFFALPLQFFQVILFPLTWIMTKITSFVLSTFFSAADEEKAQPFSRIDLENFLEQTLVFSKNDDQIQTIDHELFRNALHIRTVRVKEAMIPRNEIIAIDVKESMDNLIQLFHKSKLSRILVYKGDIDQVIGYIHHQQLIQAPKRIKNAVLKIPFFPEVMNLLEAMNLFIAQKKNIACVVDEFGGISGVITLEDILEEIFGEIEDEHDQEDHIEEQLSKDEWLLSGRLEIDYLNEKYETLDLPTGDYNTLSGYIVMTTANIPENGDTIDLDDFRFILERVSDTKIEIVRVQRMSKSEDS